MSVVVVVLPSEPVTAMILHGQTAKNASISLVTTAPASRSCLSAGISGCIPGVRKTISACTPSKYPSPTWSVAPSFSSSKTSSSSLSREVLSQARTVSPRSSSMRMSGRFETPMPSTAMRLPRKPSKYAETFSFMVSSSFSRLYLHYIRHRKKLQLV